MTLRMMSKKQPLPRSLALTSYDHDHDDDDDDHVDDDDDDCADNSELKKKKELCSDLLL